jgi:hypothetical protein
MVSKGLTESVSFEIGYSVTSHQVVKYALSQGSRKFLRGLADQIGLADAREKFGQSNVTRISEP